MILYMVVKKTKKKLINVKKLDKLKYFWGIGVEHETHIFLFLDETKGKDKKLKHYEVIDLENICKYLLNNWLHLKNYHLKHIKSKNVKNLISEKIFTDKNYNFIQEILFRKFEKTGRKCNGKYVIKPLEDRHGNSINMPEFVSDEPFKKYTFERYCNKILEQQNRFIAIISFHPQLRNKLMKGYNLYPFPYGMSNYIKVNKRILRDYTGSFHITITLPYTSKTSNTVFVERHKNFANQFQWIEPLLVSGFFSGDDKAIGTNEKRIKGAFRVTSVGWGNFAGSDVRRFDKGVGRMTNHSHNWRDGMDFFEKYKVNYCKNISPAIQLREPYAASGFSSDFRTFGGDDHISGYGMEKPNGVEIRIFDNINSNYTSRLCRIITYIAENSRKKKCNQYVYQDSDWIKSIQNIMLHGWSAKITHGYLVKLRKNLNLKLKTDSLRCWDVLKVLNDELFRKNKNGLFSKLLLKNYEKAPQLICYNRNSLENGYILKLINNNVLRKKIVHIIKECSKNKVSKLNEFTKVMKKTLTSKEYDKDIIYLYETLGCIKLKMKHGDIYNIQYTNCNVSSIFKLNNLSSQIKKDLYKSSPLSTISSLSNKFLNQF